MDGQDRRGMTAYIRYRGGVPGEHVFDDRMTGEPLPVKLGLHRVPKGVERALMEMEVGEARDLVIPPEEGYGESNPKLIQWYPRVLLKDGYEMKKGTLFLWHSDDGLATRPARVVEETEDNVMIDMNHPYAGKTIEYHVELVDLR